MDNVKKHMVPLDTSKLGVKLHPLNCRFQFKGLEIILKTDFLQLKKVKEIKIKKIILIKAMGRGNVDKGKKL